MNTQRTIPPSRCDHATVICPRCERAMEWCACRPRKRRSRVIVAKQQCVPCNDETLPPEDD